MEILNVLLRTLFFYIFILISFRIMGRREISKLSISDLTISILIAELVAISIENREDNIMLTLLPIILLVILEVILAYIELKYNTLKNITDGKPSIIVLNGKLNIKEMIKQRYSLDDLLLSLRKNGVKCLADINYAILETNGEVSIFKKSDGDAYPLPLIVDGKIDIDALMNIDKTTIWLENILNKNLLSKEDILYAFYKKNKLYIVKK